MAQIFHPSANTVSRVSVFGSFFFVGAILYIGYVLVRSPYQTNVKVIEDQPVQFSHAHHVTQLGIDCRYCHNTVEKNAWPGMPPTETCMSCHSQIWTQSPLLEPVRESWRENKPIEWVKLHDVPDFVYFHHGVHVSKGVACITCHGNVSEMPLAWKAEPMTMEWCLECHRHPESRLVDKSLIFAPEALMTADAKTPADLRARGVIAAAATANAGEKDVEANAPTAATGTSKAITEPHNVWTNQDAHFSGMTNCSTCHH